MWGIKRDKLSGKTSESNCPSLAPAGRHVYSRTVCPNPQALVALNPDLSGRGDMCNLCHLIDLVVFLIIKYPNSAYTLWGQPLWLPCRSLYVSRITFHFL